MPRDDPNDPRTDDERTNALYAELGGAGFNAVLGGNGVANDRANTLALNACGANGLRLVLADQALRNAIDGTATAPAAGARPRKSRRAPCRPSPSRTPPRTSRRRRRRTRER